jgi:hypothetical protein
MTNEAERIRTEAGYGEYEAQERLKEVCVCTRGRCKSGH